MKQINIITKYFYPVTAGIETTILDTFSILAEKGYEVRIHTSRDLYLEKDVLPEREQVRNLAVRRYRWGSFGFWPDIDWEGGTVVLENFNIFPHFQVMLYAIWLRLRKKKRFTLILTPHGGFNPEWEIFSLATALIKKIYHYTIGTALINLAVDGVHAVSEWEKQEMAKRGVRAGKIAVIENGLEKEAFIDPETAVSADFRKQVGSYGKYILQIGRIFMIKNYETAIRALKHLPPEINYVITGPIADLAYKRKLDDLIKALGLGERVIFTGVITGAEKFYLIRKALLMVHMALWESFCCVVAEGMSQGLICVVSDNTALPYLVKDGLNGYTAPARDHRALYRIINQVYNNYNSKEHEEMRQRNQAYAKTNSWEAVAERVGEFYMK